jgi:hypothetical protein
LGGGLPMPSPRVLGKPINETRFENQEKGGLSEWWELPDNSMQGSVSFLGKDPNRVITFRGKGYHMGVCNSDETSGGDLLEFNGLHRVGGDPLEFNDLHRVGGDPSYMVHPC